MKLQLDKNYRIESDEHNYILVRRQQSSSGSKRKSKPWRADGYYADLGQALKEYGRHKIKETDATTLNELLVALSRLNSHLEDVGNQCATFWGKDMRR